MIVAVKFGGKGKVYGYNTKLNLVKGASYYIVADNVTTYDTWVKVVDINPTNTNNPNFRFITNATIVEGAPKPEKPYTNIYVNWDKETICVLWKDGTKTVMKPNNEPFDYEKGIAMCFMKKAFDNRGCFNDCFYDIEEV